MNSLPTRYAPSSPATTTMRAAAGCPRGGIRPWIGSSLLLMSALMSALVAPPVLAQSAGSCHLSALPSVTPTALYRFESNIQDSTANAYHLTQVSGTTSYNTNHIEGATSASSTGPLRVGTNPPFATGFSKMSASMLIKPSSLTGDQVFYDLGVSTNGILLSLNGGNLLLEFVLASGSATTVSAPFPTDGQWHQVGYVYDSSGAGMISLYLDGYPLASNTLSGSMGTTTGGLGLFAQYGAAADTATVNTGGAPTRG